MPSTGVTAFAETVAKTNKWLDHLEQSLGWSDRHKVYMALRGVLHALRDRLSPEETAELAAQLPMLVRGFYYEGWQPAGKPLKYRHKVEFLRRVARETPWLEDEATIEGAVTAVLRLLSSELGAEGETAQVRRLLPAELRELWPQPGL